MNAKHFLKKLLPAILVGAVAMTRTPYLYGQPIANAQPGVCYGTTGTAGANPGSLFTIDAATGAATLVGSTGQSGVPGLAINSSGEIFGTTAGADANLIRIDAATGASVVIGPILVAPNILDFVDAIAFDNNGVLYGIDLNNDLYTINPVTGVATLVGATGVTSPTTLVGMAFEPGTGRLFASTGGSGGPTEDIYEINPSTAAATLIGSTGLGGSAIPDLHFAGGTLFGSENISGTFNLIFINTSTGAGTIIGAFGAGLRMSGLASFAGKPFVLLADENIEINAQVNSDGDIHANKDITFNEGNKSQHTGNLTAGDDIIIKKKNKIVGTAMAEDDVENNGTVTGGFTENAAVAEIDLPAVDDIDHGDDDVTIKEGKTLTVDPGDYEDVKVENKGTLKLKSGIYNLECLNLREKAMLVIDLSSGQPITINVDEEVIFGKNAVMKLLPSTASTELITINTDEDDDSDADFDDDEDDADRVVIGEGARVFGNIIAPETMVVLDKKSRFKGAICAENVLVLSGARFVHHSSTATFPKESEVEEPEVVSEQSSVISYQLEQNYPNPFSQIPRFAGNPSTVISFALPEAGTVTVKIFAATGQLVATLVDGEMPAGRQQLNWNGRNQSGQTVAAGVYLYRIVVQDRSGAAVFTETKRLTMLK